MITKHFWKILLIFLGIVLLGIIGSFIASYLDKDNSSTADILKSAIGIAK